MDESAMLLRLIEMVLREKDGGGIHDLLEEHDVLEHRQVRLRGGTEFATDPNATDMTSPHVATQKRRMQMDQNINWSMLSAGTLTGDEVVNNKGESLGKIEDLMLDLDRGRIAYAVLSFGGFLGMGNKLFAVPWDALKVDRPNKRCQLDLPKERLEAAPGFDKGKWPKHADSTFMDSVYTYYSTPTYW
jgi:sporulation protein YlmC with PRC-barrel domain